MAERWKVGEFLWDRGVYVVTETMGTFDWPKAWFQSEDEAKDYCRYRNHAHVELKTTDVSKIGPHFRGETHG